MDQATLANAAGVARNSISNYETGKVMPPFDVAARIAAACGVSVEWLASAVAIDHRSEGWGFESLRAHDCVETVDVQFWSIVGCQVFPDTLFPFPCEVAR